MCKQMTLTLTHKIVNILFIFYRNTWNDTTELKLFLLNRNTLCHMTVYKNLLKTPTTKMKI